MGDKMKKTAICIIMAAVLVAAVAAVIVIKNKTVKNDRVREYSNIEQAVEAADFDMDYTDRLAGVPATGYSSNSSTIEITYGDAGFIRKTLGVTDNSDRRADLDEKTEQSINGYKVTLRGRDGKYYLATWEYNSFAYTISISDSQEGATLEEMTDYINSIR
ncbi:MAG: hypothetical protein IKS39_00805 [Clostridia bacterium]|nr:hypothetical protein [Clostridia bacterium]